MDERAEVREKFSFNLRKSYWAKVLGDTKLLKQAGKPMTGPWYYLYLQPKWVLKTYPEPSDDDFQGVDHINWWTELAKDVSTHYGIVNPKTVTEMSNLCYSMPRGRVVCRRYNGRPTWVFYHGSDFKYTDAMKKEMVSAFNLTQQASAGLVKFDLDSHEVMDPSEHEEMMSILQGKKKFDTKNITKQLIPMPAFDFDDDDWKPPTRSIHLPKRRVAPIGD